MERNMLFREISADNENLKSKFNPLMSFEFSRSDIAKYQNFIKPHIKTNQNANSLTDLLFYQLHPELEGRKLKVTDKASLKNEWINIYKQIVRPLLSGKDTRQASPTKSVTSKWLDVFKDATRNKVEFLIDGEETFRSIANTIKTANKKGHFIYILGWMLDIKFELIKYDKSSTLQALLTKAANNGVEVRMLIWDNPGDEYSQIRPQIEELNKPPISIKAFLDTATYSSPQTIQNIAKATATLKGLYAMKGVTVAAVIYLKKLDKQINKYLAVKSVGSQHDKVVIVKGESGLTAFCGGIDFNRNRFIDHRNSKTNQPAGYHDVQCKVEAGAGAYKILQKFILRWENHPQARHIKLLGDNEVPAVFNAGNPFHFAQIVGTYNIPGGIIGTPDRSLEYAYRSIIRLSKEYIYIEDQYLVNRDVAKRLNTKIKESNFKKLIIVIQDPLETADMLFPNKMRKAFTDDLFANTTPAQKDKVILLMLDSQNAKIKGYHPGLHTKLLIADDEIAIIGTANVNRRSFTHDSETSVVVFDSDDAQPKFAKQLREAVWKHYLSYPANNPAFVNNIVNNMNYWRLLGNSSNPFVPLRSMLSPYRAANNDLDQRIMSAVNSPTVKLGTLLLGGPLTIPLSYLAKKDLSNKLKVTVPLLWDYIIDPEN